jgi:cobalt-zinc-cadmium efflux system membrane fusion protein
MRRFLPFAALAALCLSVTACDTENPVLADSTRAAAELRAAGFALTPDQLAHVKIAPVVEASWTEAIHTTGTVDWNANRTTPAITQVNGPIVHLLANPGDTVVQGQPLLFVSSPDVVNAVAAYRKARNREQLARRALDRNADLLKHDAIARKDYESSEADWNDAVTDVENSLEALRIFGISKEDIAAADRQSAAISPELAVRAPVSGVIVQKLVAPGQLVQAGATACYVISDTSTVWVQGHVFDRDLESVRVGDTVEASNPSLPVVFHGTVEYIGVTLDPATRTTPVRIVTRNIRGLLKKDMFLDAIIHTRTRRNVLTVPSAAVLRNDQNEPFVYVQVQPGRFERRRVAPGAEQDGRTEIVSGLRQGEQVVAEGSLFLQGADGEL